MSPLSGKGFDFDAGLFDQLVGWEGHVRVDVPVLHALNDVDRPVVILNDSVEEGAFGPVIVAGIGHHPTRKISCWSVHVAFEVALAQRVGVFAVAVNTKGAVHTVVHDHATGFHAAITPHQLVNTDES